jgi:hypothetical protein
VYTDKSKVEISQIFVVFSEYMNFTKMGTGSLAKNTLNATEFICPICHPKPKISGFQ